MSASAPLDSRRRRRSPAAVPGYLTGRRPRSKGRRYPPDPPRTEEIIAVMRCCDDGLHGDRARGLIAVLWRAGLRVQEALDLGELDLDPRRGSVLVRSGKGGRRREVGMDNWSFEQLEPWLQARGRLPVAARPLIEPSRPVLRARRSCSSTIWAHCGVAIRMPTLHAAAGSAGLAGGVAVAR